MSPDTRWLELLKASGWQAFAVAVACGLFLIIGGWGWIPEPSAWMVQAAAFGLLLGVMLSVSSLITEMLKMFPVRVWFAQWIRRGAEKRALQAYIPHMTSVERKIVSYLLAKNQTSRGIIRVAAKSGQHVDYRDVPMLIPDHLWRVLEENRDLFPYTPPQRGESEPHPWRIPWMAR